MLKWDATHFTCARRHVYRGYDFAVSLADAGDDIDVAHVVDDDTTVLATATLHDDASCGDFTTVTP